MVLAVIVTLWLAVSSFRIIACILTTLITGLLLTIAAGLLAVGVFNIISIAFIALFVGWAWISPFSFRCDTVRALSRRRSRAGAVAGRRQGGVPLALAAAATAAGFFSFLPTDYVGVGEVGWSPAWA